MRCGADSLFNVVGWAAVSIGNRTSPEVTARPTNTRLQMQLGFSQQMKMSQQMKLAPRMIQSMEILQLPIMALKERIEQELRDNEMLEDQVGDSDAPEAEIEMERAREEATEKPMDEKELLVDTERNNEADF